jgi:hypothetical protein
MGSVELGIPVVSGRPLVGFGVWQVSVFDEALERLRTRGFPPFIYRLKYFVRQAAQAFDGPELIVEGSEPLADLFTASPVPQVPGTMESKYVTLLHEV